MLKSAKSAADGAAVSDPLGIRDSCGRRRKVLQRGVPSVSGRDCWEGSGFQSTRDTKDEKEHHQWFK